MEAEDQERAEVIASVAVRMIRNTDPQARSLIAEYVCEALEKEIKQPEEFKERLKDLYVDEVIFFTENPSTDLQKIQVNGEDPSGIKTWILLHLNRESVTFKRGDI